MSTHLWKRVLAPKPKGLSFDKAASLPAAVETARGGLQSAGLSGQVPPFSGWCRWCWHNGYSGVSRVAATSSIGKLNLLKSVGADLAIDYTKDNLEDLPEKFNIVKTMTINRSIP
ncbi:hypothetical protein NL676_015000 [Syzygium grande]|nr:hypothetical protein NL676_015000 [Syzygium grande]